MEAVNTASLKVLSALGDTTATKVTASVGPEQEYFLVDKEFFEKRPDLMLAGRTVRITSYNVCYTKLLR